ncbi:protein SGT1 homolog [Lutzomyia longipalpis]|uniref:Suppressor of g2 allele of skp1 n=2 Tax=Lutzomyia longipalpis TaxID=7200 RepID=A0A1B0CCP9_LUTLO|nr:protein SGT1 homolog [Lutzomyia longipalpis]
MSVRHDWYQSETSVVVSVMIKNAKEKNYSVKIDAETVDVTADGYELHLNLAKHINPDQSSHRVTPSKIEITLKKVTGERWENLQRTEPPKPVAVKQKPNWDKFCKENENSEEAKGEEGLQKLFEKIYGDSSDEVRKAMNKSFSESSGTVLSTNWTEVGATKVGVKPPDGTEFKKWDE